MAVTDDLLSLSGVDLDPAPFVGPVRKHPAYVVWASMLTRCYNARNKQFPRYGGRGIAVCAEWRKSSRVFLTWAIASGWRPGLQLDRRDNNGPYSPENCRFVTRTVNCRNKRNTVRLPDGRAAIDVGEAVGLHREAIQRRLAAGWSPQSAISVASGSPPERRFADGRLALPVARENGITRSAFYNRLSRGWLIERAATEPPRSCKQKAK